MLSKFVRRAVSVRTATRFGWGLSDQAFSSLTNFVVAFMVARNTTTSELGVFSLAFVTYIVVLALNRAIATTPLVIRYSAVENDRWRGGVSAATGSSLVVGASAGVLVGAVTTVLPGTYVRPFLALAVCLPGLMLQDTWRFAFFAQARGARALVNDMVWAAFLLPTVAILTATEEVSPAWFVLAWGGSASVAAIFGIFQSRILPLPHRVISWWRDQRDLSGWFLADAAVTQVAQNATLYFLTALTSLAVIGTLRAMSLLFGPVSIMLMGFGLVGVPEGARALQSSKRKLRKLVVAVSLLLVLATLLWGIALLLLPSSVGRSVLGDSWDAVHPYLVLQMLFVTATAASVGPRIGLGALAAARQSLIGRLIISASVLVLPCLGVLVEGGLRGIMWGAILAEGGAVLVWYRLYLQVERNAAPGLLELDPLASGYRSLG